MASSGSKARSGSTSPSNFYSNIVGPYWPPERVLVEKASHHPFPYAEIHRPPPMRQIRSLEHARLISTWSADQSLHQSHGTKPTRAALRPPRLAQSLGDPHRARKSCGHWRLRRSPYRRSEVCGQVNEDRSPPHLEIAQRSPTPSMSRRSEKRPLARIHGRNLR